MAEYVSLNIEAGASYPLGFNIKNDDGTIKNLTGYTAQLQIRVSATAATAIVTIAGVITAATGYVATNIPAASTSLLTGSKYVYGVELTAAGGEPVYRIAEGNVFVSPEVVR